jgi:1-acyl-sn-glycerol-3-phosphate acyltransferase
MRWHKSVVIFEKPVATEGLTLDDLPKLKEQVYQIIDQELRKLSHENRQRYAPQIGTPGQA